MALKRDSKLGFITGGVASAIARGRELAAFKKSIAKIQRTRGQKRGTVQSLIKAGVEARTGTSAVSRKRGREKERKLRRKAEAGR